MNNGAADADFAGRRPNRSYPDHGTNPSPSTARKRACQQQRGQRQRCDEPSAKAKPSELLGGELLGVGAQLLEMARPRAAPSAPASPAAARAMAAAKAAANLKKARKAAAAKSKSAAAGDSPGEGGGGWSSRWALFAAAAAVVAAVCASVLYPVDVSETNPAAADVDADANAAEAGPPLTLAQVAARAAALPCDNKHDDDKCHGYAASGQCADAPGWMSVFCAASCDLCEMRDPEVRCDAARIGYEPVDAFGPGSVDALFSSLPERFPQFNVTFLSRPPDGPWVAKFHNFLSDGEIDTLIDEAGGGLRRSTDQGDFSDDGVQEQVVSTSRTSMNAWCMGACENHPTVLGVTRRIEDVTGIPSANYESFQLLRYEPGQEYRRHHDMSMEDNAMLAGPRILTFFLYLSDVDAGGGTQFTDVRPKVTVEPEKGSAILWPSVLDKDPTIMDPMTHHAALPVEKGVKFAANHWIHQRDYKTPNVWGCTGSFTE